MGRMPETPALTTKVLDVLRRELVVIAPLVLAFLATVPGDTSVADYKVWGPLLIGFFLRQFVTTPVKEAEQREDEQFRAGVTLGKVLVEPDDGFPPAV
jgi:hypothetical protein